VFIKKTGQNNQGGQVAGTTAGTRKVNDKKKFRGKSHKPRMTKSAKKEQKKKELKSPVQKRWRKEREGSPRPRVETTGQNERPNETLEDSKVRRGGIRHQIG